MAHEKAAQMNSLKPCCDPERLDFCDCSKALYSIHAHTIKLAPQYNNIVIMTRLEAGSVPFHALLHLITNSLFVHQINGGVVQSKHFVWKNALGIGAYKFTARKTGVKISCQSPYSNWTMSLFASEVSLLMNALPNLSLCILRDTQNLDRAQIRILEKCLIYAKNLLHYIVLNDNLVLPSYIADSLIKLFIEPLFVATGLTPFGFIDFLSKCNCLPFGRDVIQNMIAYFVTQGNCKDFHLIFKSVLVNHLLVWCQYKERLLNKGFWQHNQFYVKMVKIGRCITTRPNQRLNGFSVEHNTDPT